MATLPLGEGSHLLGTWRLVGGDMKPFGAPNRTAIWRYTMYLRSKKCICIQKLGNKYEASSLKRSVQQTDSLHHLMSLHGALNWCTATLVHTPTYGCSRYNHPLCEQNMYGSIPRNASLHTNRPNQHDITGLSTGNCPEIWQVSRYLEGI